MENAMPVASGERIVRLPFEPPSQSAWIVDANSRALGHVSLAGPILKMPVGDKLVDFEMHRYFGPLPLRKDGEVRERMPRMFWKSFDEWCANGKLVIGDLCWIGGMEAAASSELS